MKTVIAHVDMDCFFVACEVKRNPDLAGKPVIVGATGDRGVVSTSSYEARQFGVFSATPISKARRLCPDGIYLRCDGKLYREESRNVMNALREFAQDFVQVSVDEAYLDVTHLAEKYSWETIGNMIQEGVKKQTGLSCSVGISHCKRVAKIASDYKKPAGITVVHDQTAFLRTLAIGKVPGVGKKSLPYFQNNGVVVVGDLERMNRFEVLDKFGMWGVRIQQMLHGEFHYGLSHRTKSKSISRERTYGKDTVDPLVVKETLNKLCEKIYEDLRARSYRTVSIKVRYDDFTTITRDKTLGAHSSSKEIIRDCIHTLYEEHAENDRPLRLLGVKLSNLLNDGAQQTTLAAY